MRAITPPADSPAQADQRVADALESVLPDPAARALVLVAVRMAIKAHALAARRDLAAHADEGGPA